LFEKVSCRFIFLFANGFLFESSQPAQAGAKAKEKKPL
jgi:hypothetical protein